ncbi:transmembrane protein 235-like [Oncorhynchus kisutch]|uniref:transmembrane protein 235-like n=1 Tax=Oncorhynchus kisutch TaxID=8019 RepID=UPI0012DD827D|nr:transmembrane protein 235-like [Oncorhynchus kisutch]
MRMLNMHSVSVVFLPLSLVLLLFGGICGLISSLPWGPALLTSTVSYLFFCSVLTLSGVSLYISNSEQALAETESLVGAERLAQVVSTSFELVPGPGCPSAWRSSLACCWLPTPPSRAAHRATAYPLS